MMRVLLTGFIAFSFFGTSVKGQSQVRLTEINEVWKKFCDGFNSHRPELLREVHSTELIRVSGGQRVSGYEDCMRRYEASIANSLKKNVESTLTLRFIERVSDDSSSSERGIYQLKRKEPGKEQKEYYGKFHAFMRKIDGNWKIIADYDSTEGETIGEEDFYNAFHMDEINAFLTD